MKIHPRIALCKQYQEAGDLALAVKCAYEGLNCDPDDVELIKYIAFLHMQGRNYGLFYHLLKQVKIMSPGDPDTEHNLGLAVMNMAAFANREEFLDLGEKHFRKALCKAERWQSYSGLAQIALSRGEFDACIAHARKALGLMTPESRDETVHQTLGFALLAKEKFGEGFQEIERHVGGEMRKPKPVAKEPYWQGPQPQFLNGNVLTIGGKQNLFVQGEQGLGDEISFASCIPDVARDCSVTLECDPRLEGLFRRSFPHVEVYGTRANAKDPAQREWANGRTFDAMCLSGSLLKHYRKEKSDFPRKAFLRADSERRLQWKALLNTLPGKKIGIAWNGGVPMNFKGRRSLKLKDLDPLLKIPGVTWVSLEYKDPTEEIEHYKAKTGIEVKHWARAAESDDYDDTAALVAELDCVVSVCTAVVHLCGALGVRCHVLVPKVPRWFYGESGREHPWYESLVLHRKGKDWPLELVKQELQSQWAEAAD